MVKPVFVDQPRNSQVVKEEIFSPVFVIETLKTEEEAISKPNETEFGLYAMPYTINLERAFRVGIELASEMVGVHSTSSKICLDLYFGEYKVVGLVEMAF